MSETTFAPNTLGEALSIRYPSVWVSSVDSVEVIEFVKNHIIQYPTLTFYVFDAVEGLKEYNRHHGRYHQVMQQVENPMTGETSVEPITDIGVAISYTANDHCTMVILNAEQFENGLNDFHAFNHHNWRSAWLNNDAHLAGGQYVFASATEAAPPAQVRAFVPVVNIDFPSVTELSHIASHIVEHFGLQDEVAKAAQAAKGLSKFEAISLFSSQAARNGEFNIKELEDIKFARIASRTSLEIKRPEVTLDQVAGAENIKKILNTSIWMRENPEQAERYGFGGAMHRFLLLGLPGTGKSYFCEAAASHLNLNLVRTGMSQQMSKFVGESENNIMAMFQQINALNPVCVWADEFGRDASGGQSSHVVDAGTTTRMHGIFLTGIQELPEETYFFAAANDISTLAPEMLRADRFDKVFFVGFPTASQRLQILTQLTVGKEHHINLEKIALATASFTGAELKSGLAAATSYALAERRPVQNKDVVMAYENMKDRLWNRYREQVYTMYRAAENYHWASDDQAAQAAIYLNGKKPNESLDTLDEIPIVKTSATVS